ncbi:MAG TPA: SpoIID/LytB domain-containing protein [Acidimicrobiia bacterium]|nr:SpoIID/LytB domain-containing protein [Acidimicrobiia bacterium]
MRGRCLLVTAALLAATLLPGIGPAAAEASFTFEGGGWGHVVGLSQYGAYGMARQGYTWEEILSHYFTGAYPGDADPALLATPIWVGLAQEQSRLALTVVPTGAAPAAPAAFTLGGTTLLASSGDTVVIEPLGGGSCRLSGPTGSLEGPCSIDVTWDGWDREPTTALQLQGCLLPDWNAPGGTVWKPCRYARGSLHIRPDNDTPKINLTLEIGIEDYILGISESPYAWGTTGGQAALEAQAVAARSYALYRVVWRGDPASRPSCWCQLYDTTADQFYAGWGHGTQPWLDAVAATAGKVMLHPSETLNGALIPIQTFYGSSTFGWTENSENSFTAAVPYLRAVDDRWGILPEVGNPKARWSVSFTATRLASLLPGMSTVTGAQVTRCSETGAALQITFTGEGGPRAFSTRELRTRLSLPSLQVISVGAPPSGSPACSGFALTPAEPGGPASLAGFSVDDDTVEDSNGNGDGRAQCGETVEVFTTLANGGGRLHSLTATLSSADPYVSIPWNTSSSFPDLAAGGTAANLNDWDLVIAGEAPDGYTAHLTLRVNAANGGPWNLDLSLPLSCAAPATGLTGILADPGDVTGDGRSDVAVAYTRSGDPARLQMRDGLTGAVLFTRTLARAGYVPIAAVTVPNFADSPAAEVAVLLTGPDRPARVVVIDAASGRKIKAFGMARTAAYFDVDVVPSSNGAAPPRLAVLSTGANGAARVLLRDAATGRPVGRVGFGRGLDPAALAVFSDTGGGRLLGVLGNAATGQLQMSVRRAADGTRVRTVTLATGLAAADLVALARAGSGPLLVAVGNAPGSGGVRLVAADPATGAVVASFVIAGLGSAQDLEALADLGGGPSRDVAVLGRGPGGAARAVVLDPVTGAVLATPQLSAGYTAYDLASLIGSGDLAALGRLEAGDSLVTVRRAATGAEVSSFTVP